MSLRSVLVEFWINRLVNKTIISSWQYCFLLYIEKSYARAKSNFDKWYTKKLSNSRNKLSNYKEKVKEVTLIYVIWYFTSINMPLFPHICDISKNFCHMSRIFVSYNNCVMNFFKFCNLLTFITNRFIMYCAINHCSSLNLYFNIYLDLSPY